MPSYPLRYIPKEIKNNLDKLDEVVKEELLPEEPIQPKEPKRPSDEPNYSGVFPGSIGIAIISTVILVAFFQNVFSFIVLPLIIFIFSVFVLSKETKNNHKKDVDEYDSYKKEMREYERKKKDYDFISKEYYDLISDSHTLRLMEKEWIYRFVDGIEKIALIDFDSPKEGWSEQYFYRFLIKWFGDSIMRGKVLEIFYDQITGDKRAYVPDFLFVHPEKNLLIDIEVDEPYTKGGLLDGKNEIIPIHHIGSDDQRNNYFLDKKCVIVRFSEEQVVCEPEECCREIAKVIHHLTGDIYNRSRLEEISDLKNTPQWTYEEALSLISENYRDNYLKLITDSNSEETEINIPSIQKTRNTVIQNRYKLLIHELRYGLNDLSVAVVLYNLALELRKQGQFEEADQILRRTIKIEEEKYGGDHLEVAKSLNSLAFVLQSQAQYNEAESVLRRVLKIREDKLSADHVDVATSLHDLGSVLYDQGQFVKAQVYLRQAIKIRGKKLAEGHPTILESLNKLAVALSAEAEVLFQRTGNNKNLQSNTDQLDNEANSSNLDTGTCQESGGESHLIDYNWIKRKLETTNAQNLLTEYYKSTKSTATELVGRALTFAYEPLSKRSAELPHQLWGRLACDAVIEMAPELHKLLEYAYDEQKRSGFYLKKPSLAAPGLELYRLTGHKGSVKNAIFSPDGTRIVTASRDKTARIWDTESGLELLHLSGHEGGVNSAAFSPDGTRIVTASEDNTARIWDMESGLELLRLSGHEDEVNSATFSPDGTRILTASNDNTARIWDADVGFELHCLTGHTKSVKIALYTPDGSKAVTLSSGIVRIWDVDTGLEQHCLDDGIIESFAFSPEGSCIVTASNGVAHIWNLNTGLEMQCPWNPWDGVTSASFSPDGTCIITGSYENTGRIWDVQTSHVLQDLTSKSRPLGNEVFFSFVSYSPDGKKVIAISNDDCTVRIFDAKSGLELPSLCGHEKLVNSAVFSPDSKRILTASNDNTARIWDAEFGSALHSFSCYESAVRSVSYGPDSNSVITVSTYYDTAHIWDVKFGVEQNCLIGDEWPLSAASYSPDGTRIVTVTFSHDPFGCPIVPELYANSVRIWNAETGDELHRLIGHKYTVTSASFSPDGTRILTASYDNTARIWDAETGDELVCLSGHQDTVYSASYSWDGKHIVTASADHTARIWDAKTGNVLRCLSCRDAGFCLKWDEDSGDYVIDCVNTHHDAVYSASYSYDGRYIVTGSYDKTARVWDTKTGNELHRLMGHEGLVISAIFSPDGTRIITASKDKTARIWDAASGLELGCLSFDASLTALDFIQNSIVMGDSLGRLHYLEIDDLT